MVELQFNAPPGSLFCVDLQGLLAQLSRLAAARFPPGAFVHDHRVFAVLAHDEAGPGLVAALQDGAGAKVAVCDPDLARPGAIEQGHHSGALAFVGVFAGHQVDHLRQVGVVDHQAVARQRRAPVFAQRCQALLRARQVVAIDDAQLPAWHARTHVQRRCDGLQARAAALNQGAQQRQFGALDLVVERGQRDGQVFHLARGRVQRRLQAQADQRHQLHDRGKQQLPRVLALAVGLEHLVDPGRRHGLLQRNARHHAGRRLLFKSFQYLLPHASGPHAVKK